MTIRYPRAWSTDTNFATGPSTGLPTKVDPGAAQAAQGFVPGVTPFSPAQLNFILANHADAARYALAAHLSSFTEVTPDTAPITGANIAAVYSSTLRQVLLCKGGANSVHLVTDDGFATVRGTTGTVTGVTGMAWDPVTNTTVCVGLGGANTARSTNFGSSWTDAGTPPSACDNVTWDATNGLFIASNVSSGLGAVYTSPTGAVWTSRVLTGNSSSKHATTSGGVNLITVGAVAGSTTFNRSTNGTTWASPGSNLPNIASATGIPALCALGNTIYAACNFGSTTLRVLSSTDGINWVQPGGDITADAMGSTHNMWADAYSGALYISYSSTAGRILYASLDGGVTWFTSGLPTVSQFTALAVAGGRLWMTQATAHRMSSLRLPAA